MRIAILSPEYPPIWGGVGVYTYNLADILNKFGHEVHVITRRVGNYKPQEAAGGIIVHEVPWVKLPLLFSLSFGKNSVAKLIDVGNDFDIVHIQCPYTSMSCKTIDKIGSPVVITMHGTWEGERNALKNENIIRLKKGDLAFYLTWPFLEKYERLMLLKSKAVIAVSTHSMGEILSYGLPEDTLRNKLNVIPNGVDTQLFKPSKSAKQTLRARYGLDKDDLVVLSVGRLVARKGFRDLLLAFRLVTRKIKDVKLILVGDGPLERTLRKMATSLRISDRVIFAKEVTIDELRMHYAGAELFVLPSYYEGQGITYLEAMASGVPIVATNISAIPETVHHNENGLLVKLGNPEELADAIIELLEDDNLREGMGRKGRKMALKKYDWSLIGKRIESVYESLRNQRSIFD